MGRNKQVKGTKSLAHIAKKCNLDGDELLECVREALEKGKSRCGNLNITCRKKTKDSAIFLFESEEALHQFPIQIAALHPIPKRRSRWALY